MVQQNRIKGIIFIILSAFGFGLMSLFVRLAGDLPVFEKAFFRNVVAVCLSAVMLRRSGERLNVPRKCLPVLAARCIFGTIGLVANFWAISRIPLADANMLNKLAPVFAILFSVFLMHEFPGPVDLICVLVALTGAMFVIKPGSGMFQPDSLVGLLGAAGSGIAYSSVRKLGTNGVRGPVIVFCFSLFSCIICLLVTIPSYSPMTHQQFFFLLGAGAAATLGQFAVTAAYTYAPAKEISVFDYSQVLFAAIFAFLVWAELPDRWSLIGYVLIIGAAIWRWQMNLRADRAVSASS